MGTNNKVGRVTVLAAGAAIAAVTVVGCGAGQAAGGSASATPTTGSAPATTSAAQNSGSGNGASGQDVSAPTGGGACTGTDLSATLGSKTTVPVDPQGQLGAAGTHYRINLVWTNKSKVSCTMRGFGGVDIDGAKNSAGGPTYSLPRTGDTPATVTLAPGASAHTVINYIDPSGSAPSGTAMWTPTHLSVTPPNQTTHITVPWTAGTPVYFDPTDGSAAASISPVTAGS